MNIGVGFFFGDGRSGRRGGFGEVLGVKKVDVVDGRSGFGFVEEGVVGDVVFVLLKGEYPFFDGVGCDEVVDVNVFGLSDAVCACFGLLVKCFVPP